MSVAHYSTVVSAYMKMVLKSLGNDHEAASAALGVEKTTRVSTTNHLFQGASEGTNKTPRGRRKKRIDITPLSRKLCVLKGHYTQRDSN